MFTSLQHLSPVFNETRPERVLESPQRDLCNPTGSAVAGLDPLCEPDGDISLVLLAAGDRNHECNRVICCHGQMAAIERAEHGQCNPGQPLVAIWEWMIARNVDELGYLHLDPRGAELLFQVITEREERASIAVATNARFSGWSNTFTDPRLCSAIIDRLTFKAHIIETGTDSYRLRATRTGTTT